LVTGVLADVTDAVIVTDLHFHIRSWNSAAERIYGWTEEAVLGRHVLDVLQWVGDEGQLVQAWEHLERTGRWNGAGLQMTRDGSTVDILGTTTVLRDDSGDAVAVVSVNRLAEVAGRLRRHEMDLALAERVKQGIAAGEFVVHYQPIVDLSVGRLLGVEALLRWDHPERGLLAPAEFLDVAERSGFIVELGELVLDRACRQAAAWRHAGADILLAVNVSTRQLADVSLADRFSGILQASGFDPAYLWLEVTETAIVEELDRAALALRALVQLGVGVSIDDFGTGWASLTYLQTFPVHALKVDGSFVGGLGRDGNATAIVRSILLLGAELGLFVVAEGVETEAQHELLRSMGCTLGQGYFYGRPLPAAEVPIERAGRVAPSVTSGALTDGPHLVAGHPDDDSRGTGLDLGFDWRATDGVGSALAPEGSGGSAVAPGADWIESDAVATLLRGLLRVSSTHDAVELLQRTVRRMGGTVVPIAAAGDDALPIDVALGEGPPMLVEVERFTVARMQLERLLPRLVEDTRQAVGVLRRTERLHDETTRDGLTGLANRRVLDRVLPRLRTGAIVMLDLDHFKDVNDAHGHASGDDALRSFGRVLDAHVRAHDVTCRIGGDEFAIVLGGLGAPEAVALIERIRSAWAAEPSRPVTFSAGVATVTAEGGSAALMAADRALYRAKDLGRARTETAPDAGPDER
jgi:diguanylate cyclase (GGDEF)-like protein/PAS domain S-box-containing protein